MLDHFRISAALLLSFAACSDRGDTRPPSATTARERAKAPRIDVPTDVVPCDRAAVGFSRGLVTEGYPQVAADVLGGEVRLLCDRWSAANLECFATANEDVLAGCFEKLDEQAKAELKDRLQEAIVDSMIAAKETDPKAFDFLKTIPILSAR